MRIDTQQFGTLQYSVDTMVRFAKGLIGFEKYHKFILVDDAEYEPFKWLLSVENPSVAFPVLNPFKKYKNYGKELPGRVMKRVLDSQEHVELFCIVNLHHRRGGMTINLKSPILIDLHNFEGEQLILNKETLPVDKPLV